MTHHPPKENIQGRLFKLITYLDNDDIITSLNSINNLNYAYWCYHDKDVWTKKDEEENPNHVAGTIKEPHTHIFLSLSNPSTSKALRNVFKARDKPNTLIPLVSVDQRSEIRYLIHLDSSDKFQYSIDDIQSIGSKSKLKSALRGSKVQLYDNATQSVFDIIDGVSTRQLCEKYGRDFIYHYQSIMAVAQMIIDEERGKQNE